MGIDRQRRGGLPLEEINKIFKSVGIGLPKKDTKHSESPQSGDGDVLLADFYRMDLRDWGILQGSDKVTRQGKTSQEPK